VLARPVAARTGVSLLSDLAGVGSARRLLGVPEAAAERVLPGEVQRVLAALQPLEDLVVVDGDAYLSAHTAGYDPMCNKCALRRTLNSQTTQV